MSFRYVSVHDDAKAFCFVPVGPVCYDADILLCIDVGAAGTVGDRPPSPRIFVAAKIAFRPAPASHESAKCYSFVTRLREFET